MEILLFLLQTWPWRSRALPDASEEDFTRQQPARLVVSFTSLISGPPAAVSGGGWRVSSYQQTHRHVRTHQSGVNCQSVLTDLSIGAPAENYRFPDFQLTPLKSFNFPRLLWHVFRAGRPWLKSWLGNVCDTEADSERTKIQKK